MNRYSVITMTDFNDIPPDQIITDNFGYRFTKEELGELMKSTPLHPYVRIPWKNILFTGTDIPIGMYFEQYLPTVHSPEPVVIEPIITQPQLQSSTHSPLVFTRWIEWVNQTGGYY